MRVGDPLGVRGDVETWSRRTTHVMHARSALSSSSPRAGEVQEGRRALLLRVLLPLLEVVVYGDERVAIGALERRQERLDVLAEANSGRTHAQRRGQS